MRTDDDRFPQGKDPEQEAPEEDLIDEQDLEGQEEPDDQDQEQEPDGREDWKAKAIEAQTRLRMLEEQQNQQQQMQQPEPQRDEVAEIRDQINEIRQNMPALDDKNPQTFWERERAKDQIGELQEKMVDARLRQQENVMLEQQVGTVVQSYKARHSNSAEFKAVEQQFDQMVGRLQPHLKGNEMMLDMIRKNLEHDHMKQRQSGRKPPPQAPSGAYQPQKQAQKQQRKGQQPQWQSEQDQRVGEYYMSRGIISGPEEFYDPKFNEASETANKNGVAIYDIPDKPRGWRR